MGLDQHQLMKKSFLGGHEAAHHHNSSLPVSHFTAFQPLLELFLRQLASFSLHSAYVYASNSHGWPSARPDLAVGLPLPHRSVASALIPQ